MQPPYHAYIKSRIPGAEDIELHFTIVDCTLKLSVDGKQYTGRGRSLSGEEQVLGAVQDIRDQIAKGK